MYCQSPSETPQSPCSNRSALPTRAPSPQPDPSAVATPETPSTSLPETSAARSCTAARPPRAPLPPPTCSPHPIAPAESHCALPLQSIVPPVHAPYRGDDLQPASGPAQPSPCGSSAAARCARQSSQSDCPGPADWTTPGRSHPVDLLESR